MAHASVVAGEEDDDSGDEERNYLDDINPESKRVVSAYVEAALAAAPPDAHFQFERQGYFVSDLVDTAPGRPVFNQTVTLKDSWARQRE